MAVIVVQDGWVALGPHCVLGRSPACAVRLESRQVSAEHASVRWSDGAWRVRDLGSRNGTMVDGTPLEPGKATVLAVGSRLRLGTEVEILVVDVAPPGPAAIREGGEAVTAAADGLLALPSTDNPLALLHSDADGAWCLEVDGDPTPIPENGRLELGGEVWRILVPATPVEEEVLATWSANARPPLSEVRLVFRPSADEEQVDVQLSWPGGTTALSPRNHQFLMLELARARIADETDGTGEAEAGWRYTDDLQRALRVEPAVLNLYLFRGREQVAQAGIDGAAGLFERRRLSGQIRLGTRNLVVVQPT